MLLKLILKITLKALLPFVAVLGVSAYAIYLKGGDPLGMARDLAQSTGVGLPARASSALQSMTQAAGSSLDSLKAAGNGGSSSAKDQVYRWTDADGVTHFSSTKPEPSVGASMILVDPDQNMIPASKTPSPASASTENTVPKKLPLPGVGGIVLPNRSPEEILGQIE